VFAGIAFIRCMGRQGFLALAAQRLGVAAAALWPINHVPYALAPLPPPPPPSAPAPHHHDTLMEAIYTLTSPAPAPHLLVHMTTG
jgi:hypothetical protein